VYDVTLVFVKVFPVSTISIDHTRKASGTSTCMTKICSNRVDVLLEHRGSPQSKRNKEWENTEPKDKKTRHSTSIEKKQDPKSRIPKPIGDKST
jgi:hypothetical protein